jgi:hypothetical protein
MADLNAVMNLFARYAYANDARDMNLMEQCFTQDSTFALQIAGGTELGPFEGREAVLGFIRPSLEAQTDLRKHVMSNYWLDGDEAHAYLSLIVTDNGLTELKSCGIYECTVVEDGGELKFSRMNLALDNGF